MGTLMEAFHVFHFVQSRLQQLTDLNHFASKPILSLFNIATKFQTNMLPSSLQFTTRGKNTEHRVPNGSLLSLRTFYAYGARSRRTSSLQRSFNQTYGNNSVDAKLSLQFTPTHQRSSTASCVQNLQKNIICRNRFFTPISYVSKPYSNSFLQNQPTSKVNNGQIQHLETKKSSAPKMVRSIAVNTPTQCATDTKNAYQNVINSLSQCEKPVTEAIQRENEDEALKFQENFAKMITLMEKNKLLEAEVDQLKQRLKEKEHSENELKRKVLEYAAEIEVWKRKYEMQQQTASIEISEPTNNEEEITDIMEQLNTAAERLTRLNAVKDLRLLQSEMETALKEISK